ncbi:VOC family protein [Bdellovibrio sp. HCB288]|uniref:VOC family protein n=1 Tax=Bdellovibrio sp. HCB288 TaxID=3394355 RepID=UPI0039B5B3C4
MSNFTLDHIFCFCESQLSGEAEKATNVGFTLYPGNRHPGQGTANRAIMFEDNYLEFIFLESVNDAQKNPLRLDKRADWRNTGASPFGICLRGAIAEADSYQFWAYHPPYWQGGVIFVHKSNESSPQ